MSGLSAREIADRLRADADALARVLLPQGAYEDGKREWRASSQNSPTGGAVSVHVGRGVKQGVVGFWSGQARQGGDMLDLVEAAMGLSKRDAVHWAMQWLQIEGTEFHGAIQRPAPRTSFPDDSAKARRIAAERIWKESFRLASPATDYLRSRGINPGFADGSLRTHPQLKHRDGVFPALVGRVERGDLKGEFCGVWRTFLKIDGSGKAPVDNPKLGLGLVAGGAVRIGGVWPSIGIAEGIETALACRQIVAQTTGAKIAVWSALSSQGLRVLELPEEVRKVRIFADADTIRFKRPEQGSGIAPSPGIAAAQELADRLKARGVAVEIELPPAGTDWLDVLKANQECAR